MRIYLTLFLTTIVSCNSYHDAKKDLDIAAPRNEDVILPHFVQDYLSANLHGWILASKNNWNDTAWNKYTTDKSKMSYILADVNCDGKPDFTGILQDSTGNFATFQIYSVEQYYVSKHLESYGSKKKLDLGLRLIDAQIPFKHYDSSLETFKCGAVERFNIYNGGKKIFYANEKGFFEIEVGE